MNRRLILLLLLTLTLGGCDKPLARDAISMRIGVTSSAAPLADDLLREYDRHAPHVSFEISRGNGETLSQALAAGRVDWGLVTYLAVDSELWSAPVGTDGLAIIVHPGNGISGLTRADVRNVFRGQVLTWKALSDANGSPIHIVTREPGSAARGAFDELVMAGTPVSAAAWLATSSAQMLEIVAGDVDAIGYVSLAMVDLRVRPIDIEGEAPSQATTSTGAYPLTTTLRFVARDEPDGPAADFLRWVLSDEGQVVIEQHYARLVR